MAFEIPGYKMSRVAGADLSAAANKYKFVKLDASSEAILCAAATDIPVGVLQNTPGLGGEAEIMVSGISKVQADAALATPGTLIGTSADGQADAKVPGTDLTEYVVGQTVGTAGGAGELVSCLINCMAPHRAQ